MTYFWYRLDSLKLFISNIMYDEYLLNPFLLFLAYIMYNISNSYNFYRKSVKIMQIRLNKYLSKFYRYISFYTNNYKTYFVCKTLKNHYRHVSRWRSNYHLVRSFYHVPLFIFNITRKLIATATKKRCIKTHSWWTASLI